MQLWLLYGSVHFLRQISQVFVSSRYFHLPIKVELPHMRCAHIPFVAGIFGFCRIWKKHCKQRFFLCIVTQRIPQSQHNMIQIWCLLMGFISWKKFLSFLESSSVGFRVHQMIGDHCSQNRMKCYLQSSWKAFLWNGHAHEKPILRADSSPRNVWPVTIARMATLACLYCTSERNRGILLSPQIKCESYCAFSNNIGTSTSSNSKPPGEDRAHVLVRPLGYRSVEAKLMWQSNRKVTYECEHAHRTHNHNSHRNATRHTVSELIPSSARDAPSGTKCGTCLNFPFVRSVVRGECDEHQQYSCQTVAKKRANEKHDRRQSADAMNKYTFRFGASCVSSLVYRCNCEAQKAQNFSSEK